MKIAAVVDSAMNLKPLDQGERVVLLSDDGSVSNMVENPGFGFTHGGKEQAMEVIISLGADAVVVGEQFLCPCTYRMSKGKLRYVQVKVNTLDHLRSEYALLSGAAAEDVPGSVYYEEEHAHDHSTRQKSQVNASLGL